MQKKSPLNPLKQTAQKDDIEAGQQEIYPMVTFEFMERNDFAGISFIGVDAEGKIKYYTAFNAKKTRASTTTMVLSREELLTVEKSTGEPVALNFLIECLQATRDPEQEDFARGDSGQMEVE